MSVVQIMYRSYISQIFFILFLFYFYSVLCWLHTYIPGFIYLFFFLLLLLSPSFPFFSQIVFSFSYLTHLLLLHPPYSYHIIIIHSLPHTSYFSKLFSLPFISFFLITLTSSHPFLFSFFPFFLLSFLPSSPLPSLNPNSSCVQNSLSSALHFPLRMLWHPQKATWRSSLPSLSAIVPLRQEGECHCLRVPYIAPLYVCYALC